MNAFEMFLSLREPIVTNPEIVKKLVLYSHNFWGQLYQEKLLKRLGEGTQNVVSALGSIQQGSRLEFLAIREMKDRSDMPEFAKESYNQYIDHLVSLQKGGKLVPRFCGGIGVKEKGKFRRYFLLVEDFTKNGAVSFIEGGSDEREGLLDGKPIAYDFATDRFPSSEVDYFAEESLLIVEGEKVYFQ